MFDNVEKSQCTSTYCTPALPAHTYPPCFVFLFRTSEIFGGLKWRGLSTCTPYRAQYDCMQGDSYSVHTVSTYSTLQLLS